MDPMQAYMVARSLAPWNEKEHDDLDPKGDTLAEVVDHWLACRVDVFDVGLGQARYCLTDSDVRHLVEHIEKWRKP